MDYQSGINPDWCVRPNWKRDTITCYTGCCHLCGERRWLSSIYLFSLSDMRGQDCFDDQTTGPTVFTYSGREETTEEDIHLFSPFTHLSSSPSPLSAWLAAELTDCLDGWLPLSLDAHFTHTLSELRWGWGGERQSGLLGLWGSGISLLNFSPFLFVVDY